MELDRQQSLDIFRGAIARISGQNGEPTIDDFEASVADLTKVAPLMPGAKAKLAVLTALGAGTATDENSANELFLQAAMGGLPPIVRELGSIMLMSGLDDGLAGTLLRRALEGGDWIAGFLIVREAMRGRYFLSKDQLKKVATSLSETVPFKSEIITAIGDLPADISVDRPVDIDPAVCRRALELAVPPVNDNPPQSTMNGPEIAVRDDGLAPFECDYLIAISCGLMQPSKVVSAEDATSLQTGYRTSDGAVLLPHLLDLPTVRIIQKLSNRAGIEPSRGEFLSLLRYKPGQEYRPHHDFLEPDSNDYSMIKRCGQRCATLLTYLNDRYEGGETAFPKLDFKYEGAKGASLYFRNTDQSGAPIQDSLHAGLPITGGEKWLATLWIREKPFWPWARQH